MRLWLTPCPPAGVPAASPRAGLSLETGLQHGEAWDQPQDSVQEPAGCGQSCAAHRQRHGQPGMKITATEIGHSLRLRSHHLPEVIQPCFYS